MKKIILMPFVSFLFILSQAQIANTKWKSILMIDGPVNSILDFKKDTAVLYTVADSTIIETMTYSSNDTSITLTKIEGQSDCDDNTPGKYNFKINGDVLYLNMIADDCYDRSSVIDSTKWTKWKEPREVNLNEDVLKQYVGVYQLDASHPITISFENGKLYAEGPNNRLPKSVLIAESDTKFFLRIAGVEWDFVKDANGKVVKLISHEGKDYELKKVH